jgi:glucosamine-6-phosphate deaminase
MLTVILPVGPLDYSLFAEEVNRRQLSLYNLRTINMDEYTDEHGDFIPDDHPMSFKKFVQDYLLKTITKERWPDEKNIIFPDPHHPEAVTQLIDDIGGADICWGGFGITSHIAFNDPPSMLGEPDDLESFLSCKTRRVAISPASNAQMLMGATFGNDEILPKHAVTIGMYEILKSKKLHLTFMRNWHRGLWRRAFFGPVTQQFPGSAVQRHPNIEVTMTKNAAELPLITVAQETGE